MIALIFSLGCKTSKTNTSGNSETGKHEIHVRQMGAVPNDNLDDSGAIQRAIDKAIQSEGISLIRLEPGVYDIHKGIIISNHQSNGEYAMVTVQMSGHIPAYSPNQNLG